MGSEGPHRKLFIFGVTAQGETKLFGGLTPGPTFSPLTTLPHYYTEIILLYRNPTAIQKSYYYAETLLL